MFVRLWTSRLTQLLIFPFPASEKRGFADVNPRLAAGKMPNDSNPKPDKAPGFDGDDYPAPPDHNPEQAFAEALAEAVAEEAQRFLVGRAVPRTVH